MGRRCLDYSLLACQSFNAVCTVERTPLMNLKPEDRKTESAIRLRRGRTHGYIATKSVKTSSWRDGRRSHALLAASSQRRQTLPGPSKFGHSRRLPLAYWLNPTARILATPATKTSLVCRGSFLSGTNLQKDMSFESVLRRPEFWSMAIIPLSSGSVHSSSYSRILVLARIFMMLPNYKNPRPCNLCYLSNVSISASTSSVAAFPK
jgi:hypothetical protein